MIIKSTNSLLKILQIIIILTKFLQILNPILMRTIVKILCNLSSLKILKLKNNNKYNHLKFSNMRVMTKEQQILNKIMKRKYNNKIKIPKQGMIMFKMLIKKKKIKIIQVNWIMISVFQFLLIIKMIKKMIYFRLDLWMQKIKIIFNKKKLVNLLISFLKIVKQK